MPNPFEDPDSLYRVIMNGEGLHSLWSAVMAVPDGWVIAHEVDSRSACIEHIEENWTDMRPKSLIQTGIA